uniref:Uncharacterized protein n=1 Tax=Anguilla anguilla TaxID=7936 RepID=A0A0E9WXI1_ANGAN
MQSRSTKNKCGHVQTSTAQWWLRYWFACKCFSQIHSPTAETQNHCPLAYTSVQWDIFRQNFH